METRKLLLDEKFLEIDIGHELIVVDRLGDLFLQFFAQLIFACRISQLLSLSFGEIHDHRVADLAGWVSRLDAVVGLIPGIGDVVGGVMSTWIIFGALRHRVRPGIIMRMILNVCIDLLFGAVPVAGDVFDFMFEENMRNMRLLELHRDRRRPPRSTGEIALVFTLILCFVIAVALGLVMSVIALVLWAIAQRAQI